ncbi:hypothetical protein L3Y34_018004 [Caenorhabditis briggsae]|uniref:RNase H type-1 domain-containing protein n=1 Tax=Caenorhabditis briggsae TaxID=6238 RepID=A0AAE9DKK9_CAEBR|nr:hypothetical protein L3Y34_018004 [Caenorhabditis briggsae]
MQTEWVDAFGTPIVYIFGVSSDEGKADARAGYGIDWGPVKSKKIGAVAFGEKTELRALLTAIWVAINEASECKIPSIVIRHRSRKLDEALKRDRSSLENSKDNDEDLFAAIQEIINILPVSIERTNAIRMFNVAAQRARRTIGQHSTAVEPYTNHQFEEGYRIVDIHGACYDGIPNAKAAYGIYWGEGDPRNENGTVKGMQSSYRAYFIALYRALAVALDSNHDELIIRSRGVDIHNCISKKIYPTEKNRDLFGKLCSVMPRFKKLIHWMSQKDLNVNGQIEAEHLAKIISGNIPKHVTIFGMATANDGIGRYGIYWRPGDRRNGSGWVEGPHSRLCLEMAALEVAIKNGIDQYVQHLTVYTDSEDLKEYITNWRHVWRDTSWPPPMSSVDSSCVTLCRDLTSMLDRITVEVRDGKEGYIDEARKLADSVQAFQTVRTYGSVQTGNNEAVGRYGLYWLFDQTEAEYGFVDGVASEIRSKQTAIIRAFQIALRKGFTKIVIQSDLIEKEGLDDKLQREIKNFEKLFEVVRYEENHSDEFVKLLETM